MVVRNTTLVLKPGTEEQMKRLWQEGFLPLTTPERGCVARRLLKSLEQPDKYMVMTGWTSRAAMDAHFASEEFARFNKILGGLMAETPEPELFEVIG